MIRKKLSLLISILITPFTLAQSTDSTTLTGQLSDQFIKGEHLYCEYKYEFEVFYVVKRHIETCSPTAIGDVVAKKKVKKPTLKVPRVWKDVR
ncbi:hypothetical protein BCU70_02615 [Vibrio sp. 10N.286.49.C2]|nr:hypothetical protein BCU70_02615 [Vibrio sp. 10N.286.49.C2]PMH53602.1 hypothetical protein BCU66_12220 [Vibrio sp. 10N.286.49.B1]